jgi:hypothetical protein
MREDTEFGRPHQVDVGVQGGHFGLRARVAGGHESLQSKSLDINISWPEREA